MNCVFSPSIACQDVSWFSGISQPNHFLRPPTDKTALWLDDLLEAIRLASTQTPSRSISKPISSRLEVQSATLHRERIDLLLKEIENYRTLPAGWDGYCEEPPCPQSLDVAKKFARSLLPGPPIPTVAISGGEDVQLYWKSEGRYLSVKFKKNKKIPYYYRDARGEDACEDLLYSEGSLPSQLLELIDKFSG